MKKKMGRKLQSLSGKYITDIHDVDYSWSRRKQFALRFKKKSQISIESTSIQVQNYYLFLLIIIYFHRKDIFIDGYEKNDRTFEWLCFKNRINTKYQMSYVFIHSKYYCFVLRCIKD